MSVAERRRGHAPGMSVKAKLGRKAATSVAKHTVHGTVSKARRDPMRASRLLGAGAVLGVLAGFLAGRKTAPKALAPPPVPYTPPAAAPVGDPFAASPDGAHDTGLEAVAPIVPPDGAA